MTPPLPLWGKKKKKVTLQKVKHKTNLKGTSVLWAFPTRHAVFVPFSSLTVCVSSSLGLWHHEQSRNVWQKDNITSAANLSALRLKAKSKPTQLHPEELKSTSAAQVLTEPTRKALQTGTFEHFLQWQANLITISSKAQILKKPSALYKEHDGCVCVGVGVGGWGGGGLVKVHVQKSNNLYLQTQKRWQLQSLKEAAPFFASSSPASS